MRHSSRRKAFGKLFSCLLLCDQGVFGLTGEEGIQAIMVEKGLNPTHKGAGHIESDLRKQRVNRT